MQAIDVRYWERHAEVSCKTTTTTTSGHRSEKSDSSKMDAKSKGSSHSKQKNTSGSSQSKGSTSKLRKFIPNLTSKLRKDGKLTPQECQHHMDKNLCLFCGTLGHVAKDCPKSMLVASKAHTVKTTQESTSLSKPSGMDLKKRLSSPRDYARPEDCTELPRAETTLLGTSALSNPDPFLLSLTTNMLPNMILKSLVDSGSSNSFIDATFVQTQHLPTYGIPPIKLCLIDGTSNSTITQALDLQLCFPTGETQNLTFFVTPLDHSCTIVLGYHWLTCFP